MDVRYGAGLLVALGVLVLGAVSVLRPVGDSTESVGEVEGPRRKVARGGTTSAPPRPSPVGPAEERTSSPTRQGERMLPRDLGVSAEGYTGTAEQEASWNALDDALRELAALDWAALDEAGWQDVSEDLSDAVEEAEAAPCEEKLAHLGTYLELLVQSGRAGENANRIGREFGTVDGKPVNLRWYRAASILQDEGLGLMKQDATAEVVELVRSRIGGGEFPELGLCETFTYGPIE